MIGASQIKASGRDCWLLLFDTTAPKLAAPLAQHVLTGKITFIKAIFLLKYSALLHYQNEQNYIGLDPIVATTKSHIAARKDAEGLEHVILATVKQTTTKMKRKFG